MYDFPVHNCTQEQDGSPYLSFIVRQQMTVSVKKSCYHGNLMSQVSPQQLFVCASHHTYMKRLSAFHYHRTSGKFKGVHRFVFLILFLRQANFKLYRVFSLTWSASMQIYWNKRKRLHKKRVQLPQDLFGTPTWPPFHCFGTPIWRP